MSNKLKKLPLLNSKFIQLAMGGLLIGLPILTIAEAKADMHTDTPAVETPDVEETPGVEEETPVYNNIDGGADGEPVATVVPSRGTVNVRLKNDTNVPIDYQAVGYTENQTLEGGEKHTMINLPVPVVIRSARQDDGFIKIMPLADKDRDGVLEVGLEEDPEFYDDPNIGVIRIEEDGSVYLN